MCQLTTMFYPTRVILLKEETSRVFTHAQDNLIILSVNIWVFKQVDMLSEINIAPRILTNFTGVMPSQFKKDLDSYLKTRSPVTFLSELRSNLQVELP